MACLIRSDSLAETHLSTASIHHGWRKIKPQVDSFLLIKSAHSSLPENISTSVSNVYSLGNTCHNIIILFFLLLSWWRKRWSTDNLSWKSWKDTRRKLKPKDPTGEANVFCTKQEWFALGKGINCTGEWCLYHLVAKLDTLLSHFMIAQHTYIIHYVWYTVCNDPSTLLCGSERYKLYCMSIFIWSTLRHIPWHFG